MVTNRPQNKLCPSILNEVSRATVYPGPPYYVAWQCTSKYKAPFPSHASPWRGSARLPSRWGFSKDKSILFVTSSHILGRHLSHGTNLLKRKRYAHVYGSTGLVMARMQMQHRG